MVNLLKNPCNLPVRNRVVQQVKLSAKNDSSYVLQVYCKDGKFIPILHLSWNRLFTIPGCRKGRSKRLIVGIN